MALYKYSKGGLQKIRTQLQLNTYGHEYGISLLNEQNELVIKKVLQNQSQNALLQQSMNFKFPT